jgi:hypothetical protein
MSLEAARKDSAVHVSLSSDSLFKQPGALQLHPRKPGKNFGEAIKLPTTDRKLCHLFKSAMLRKARRHARAVRRASGGYIFGRPFRVNTITTKNIAPGQTGRCFQQMGSNP